MSDRTARSPLSRADQLRQKRQPSSRTLVTPVKKPAPRPVQRAAAVTTRSYPYSTPLRQSVNTSPRRKIYRVGANGVETRLPSLPVIHFNWQWLSGSLTVILLVLVLLLTNLPAFEVNSMDIKGIQRITNADVETILRNSTGSIFTLDRQKTIDSIAIAFPELTDIRLRVGLSGTVNLSVRERQPILAWISGDQTLWVDAEGVVMPPRGDAGTLLTIQSVDAAPLTKPAVNPKSALDYAMLVLERKTTPLTPQDAMNNIDPVVLKAAIDLSAQMPAGATLVYDSISGMGWQDPRGWKVYFGLSLANIQFKQLEYQAIVDRLGQMGITPSTISVEHIDAPYYRTE
ncbi:MAG: cell division protein FtsQ [Chloroflexi bacterium]|nr:MAG: cell division protein FtsQ [Chloroflexota bacterium]MBA4375299.1 hypothetical protein [Anaerolinea sp.]